MRWNAELTWKDYDWATFTVTGLTNYTDLWFQYQGPSARHYFYTTCKTPCTGGGVSSAECMGVAGGDLESSEKGLYVAGCASMQVWVKTEAVTATGAYQYRVETVRRGDPRTVSFMDRKN